MELSKEMKYFFQYTGLPERHTITIAMYREQDNQIPQQCPDNVTGMVAHTGCTWSHRPPAPLINILLALAEIFTRYTGPVLMDISARRRNILVEHQVTKCVDGI